MTTSITSSSITTTDLTVDSADNLLKVDPATNRVGIGTATPINLLHVKSAVNNGSVITLESTATDSYPFLRLKNDAREYQITNHGPLGDKYTIYDGTAGAHRFVIDTNGNVGIGTTSPESQLTINRSNSALYSTLRFTNSGASGRQFEIGLGGSTAAASFANNLYFYDSTASSNRMVITSSGYVGIGTSAPSKSLTVATPQTANTVMEVLRLTGSGTYNSSGSSEAGAGVSFGQYSGTYPTWNLGQISGVRSGAGWSGALIFSTNSGSTETSITERMRIDSSGNVIIGDVNTEGYKLEVVSDNAANNLMVHKKNAVGPGLATNIAMQVTQTNGQSARLAELGADFESGWGGSLHFSTKNNNGSPNNSTTERMRIDYDGRITMPYQPSFCAGVGSSYTLVNFAQKINHSHEFSDIGGHYNNTNNRFTAPVAGNYFFWHRMNFGNAGTGNVEAKIYINGVERFRDYEYAGGTSQYNNSLALGTYYMNAGDYAEPWSHVNNTPQPTLVGSTTIQISTFGGWLNT